MGFLHKKNAKLGGRRSDPCDNNLVKKEEAGYHCEESRGAYQQQTISRIHTLQIVCLFIIIILCILFFSALSSSSSFPSPFSAYFTTTKKSISSMHYLYWGRRIDCPGKHCENCAGLGHQESSLRCALEEAMFLHRTFVIPSDMCINQQHNDKGLLHKTSKLGKLEGWGVKSCAMLSLYNMELISQTVRVILDTSSEWQQAVSGADLSRAVANVEGVSRNELLSNIFYSEATIINRTASPLAWFVECKDRSNRTAVLLPYSFLPRMVAVPLQLAAEKIIARLGDYDAVHVRRGDKLKIRKDRFGVNRTLLPHLDRDTRPHAIIRRISKWVPEGRTLFIASNERSSGFFDPLASKYKVVFSSHFKDVLDSVVHNNYQLFMVERLILMGAKTYVKTFKEEPSDLSLTDDGKKKIREWEIPVYTFDEPPTPL